MKTDKLPPLQAYFDDWTPRTRHEVEEYARAAIEADRRLRAVPGGMVWQPIETAPKDGTHILAILPDSDTCHVICWADASKGIRVGCGVYGWHVAWDGYPCAGHSTPTHWMPLPAAPTAAAGGADGLTELGINGSICGTQGTSGS